MEVLGVFILIAFLLWAYNLKPSKKETKRNDARKALKDSFGDQYNPSSKEIDDYVDFYY
jgi:hypothetical protein